MQRTSILSAKSFSYTSVIFLRCFLGVALWLLSSGCGYIIEGSNPVLPNEAQTLSVPPIQNLTFKAGLEIDLADQLNILLRANNSVEITPSGIADLQLKITLLSLKTISSGLSKEQITSGVKTIIKGQVYLKDMRTGVIIWKESALEVKLTESGANETSSVSSFSLSRSIRESIKLFAIKIYDHLFNNF